jgi:hypothetical protein
LGERQRAEQFEQQMGELTTERDVERVRLGSLGRELDAARQELDRSTGRARELEERIVELSQASEDAGDRLSTLQEELSSRERREGEWRRALDLTERRVREAEERAERERAHRAAIEEGLAELTHSSTETATVPAPAAPPPKPRRAKKEKPPAAKQPPPEPERKPEPEPPRPPTPPPARPAGDELARIPEQSRKHLAGQSDGELADTYESTREAVELAVDRGDDETAEYFRVLRRATVAEAASRPDFGMNVEEESRGLSRRNRRARSKSFEELSAARQELLEAR